MSVNHVQAHLQQAERSCHCASMDFKKCCITDWELADEIGLGWIHSVLTEDLGIKRVSVKFVPKLLTMKQKKLHLKIAQDMLDIANSNFNDTNIVITGDESWFTAMNRKKQCCSHHIAEEKREARQVHSKRSCWPFLSTILRWCIIRTNHNVKILQKSATWSCLDAPGTLCCANDQNRGWHNLGSSIMTMHPSVVQIWMRLSPPNATSMQYVRPPNPLCDFWSFPYMKMPLKEPNLRRHCVKRSSPAHWDYERYLPEVCAITGETTWKGLQVVYLLFNECISANQGLDTSWMHLIK